MKYLNICDRLSGRGAREAEEAREVQKMSGIIIFSILYKIPF